MFLNNASLKIFQGAVSLTDSIRSDFYLFKTVVINWLSTDWRSLIQYLKCIKYKNAKARNSCSCLKDIWGTKKYSLFLGVIRQIPRSKAGTYPILMLVHNVNKHFVFRRCRGLSPLNNFVLLARWLRDKLVNWLFNDLILPAVVT